MSIVYTVNYQQAIVANVTASSDTFDVDDSAIFDARGSRFANHEALGLDPSKGIVYAWKCPEPFTAYCTTWHNSPVLEITPAAFKSLGGRMLNKYRFTVQTWSVESGTEPPQVFESGVTVEWKVLQAPNFGLMIPGAA